MTSNGTDNETYPFCNMQKDRIVAETDLVITVNDGFPVSSGHTLVISKRRFASPVEASDDEMADIRRAVRVAAERLRAEHQPAGVDIGVNDGTLQARLSCASTGT